jgi:hypothetical protein
MHRSRTVAVFALAFLTVLLALPGTACSQPMLGQDGITSLPWLQPPAEFKEMQKTGFHAGVQAAVKDYDKHRDPDLERHKEYVHPKVDHSFVPDYREGYKRGYNEAFKHLIKSHGQAS